MQSYPKPERISTKGGPGNFATFCIRAIPLPEISEEEKVLQLQQESETGQHQAYYETTSPGDVKPSWLVRWLFRDDQIHLGDFQKLIYPSARSNEDVPFG